MIFYHSHSNMFEHIWLYEPCVTKVIIVTSKCLKLKQGGKIFLINCSQKREYYEKLKRFCELTKLSSRPLPLVLIRVIYQRVRGGIDLGEVPNLMQTKLMRKQKKLYLSAPPLTTPIKHQLLLAGLLCNCVWFLCVLHTVPAELLA